MNLRRGLFVFAALLTAAHYFRAGNWLLVALCMAAPLLFFYRKRGTLVVLQVCAYGASASWLAALLSLVQMRQQTGRSWTLAAVILGSVVLYTLVTGLLLNSRCMREHYAHSSLR